MPSIPRLHCSVCGEYVPCYSAIPAPDDAPSAEEIEKKCGDCDNRFTVAESM
jgi:hypothetical protein